MSKQIKLPHGLFTLVDNKDFEYLNQWRWKVNNYGYVVRNVDKDRWHNRKSYSVYMHRVICGTPTGMETDHINHNTLDNRRRNLRVLNHKENTDCRKERIIKREKDGRFKKDTRA